MNLNAAALSRLSHIASVFGVAVSLCGCGSDVYELSVVKGKVMCNGQPAEGGIIVFDPIDEPGATGRPAGEPGRASRGMVGKDGTFELVIDSRGAEPSEPGAVTGKHRVSFGLPNTKPVVWRAEDDWLPEDEKAKLKAEMAAIPVFKPLACGSSITPGEVEVKSGENAFDFELGPGRGNPK